MTLDPVDEAVRLLDEARRLRAAGNAAEARALADDAVAMLVAECGADHPDVANGLLEVGGCFEDAGDYGAAEKCYRRAAAIMGAFTAEPAAEVHQLRVQSLVAVGQIERILGHLDEAFQTLSEAIAVAEDNIGADHPDTGSALNAFGIVCKYAGRFAEGEVAYRRALAIVETTSGHNSPEAATVWHNLGGLAFDAGDYEAAEPRARRAVDIREAALGADHPDVAADVAALAAVVDALGRTDEAVALYRRALAVFEHTEGADYDLAVLHNNLGVTAAQTGDKAGAEQHYAAALALKERLLGPTHPDVAVTLQNLGMLTGSRDLVERALAIFESSLRREHAKVVDCRAALAEL